MNDLLGSCALRCITEIQFLLALKTRSFVSVFTVLGHSFFVQEWMKIRKVILHMSAAR